MSGYGLKYLAELDFKVHFEKQVKLDRYNIKEIMCYKSKYYLELWSSTDINMWR